MSKLTISLVQSDLHWEDVDANLKMFSEKLLQVPAEAQVVVLPEMFSTAFTMQPERVAETMDGKAMQWMREQACKHRKIITGSLAVKEEAHYFNRLVWMQPNGVFHCYDKRHLFGFAGEDNCYTAGEKRVIVQVNGWKVNLQICYDLRFPVWARQKPEADSAEYDAILYVANWPERRIAAWDALLRARAIENQCYAIGVNRVGYDAQEIYHNGSSALIDPLGETLWNAIDEEAVFTYTLDKTVLENARDKMPFLKDGDRFLLV